MAKIGIMGGTFDPIHIGHLIAAETARVRGGLDEIWFIPTADPPLKANAPLADANGRFEMVRLAIEANEHFRVLDIELKRGGVSYSIDTATELKRQYPACSFYYIIGSDRINDLPSWHRIVELIELVQFVGLERPGEPASIESLPTNIRSRLHLIEMTTIGVSSTDIRERLAKGQSIRYLVPEPVCEHIRRHGWYGSTANH